MKTLVAYHLCPRCFRATPAEAEEQFCPNDGVRLLKACPSCQQMITSPYARHCTSCGYEFIQTVIAEVVRYEADVN